MRSLKNRNKGKQFVSSCTLMYSKGKVVKIKKSHVCISYLRCYCKGALILLKTLPIVVSAAWCKAGLHVQLFPTVIRCTDVNEGNLLTIKRRHTLYTTTKGRLQQSDRFGLRMLHSTQRSCHTRWQVQPCRCQ